MKSRKDDINSWKREHKEKNLLLQKAKEKGLSDTKLYVDDGYTGTNFNRPGFQQMLSDIEMGYIYAVRVKYLSCLG